MNRLSQTHLKILASCPRKFQYVFLDRLQVPTSPQEQERLEWGSRFHQLMQQRELELPVAALLAADPAVAPLETALSALAAALPAPAASPHWRAAEHVRTLQLEDTLLTVIYDLLVVEKTQAAILDWKTYPQPQAVAQLAADWQTRLYLYVLAETLGLAPERLAMTYWFVRPPAPPQSATVPYDRSCHEATHEELQGQLAQLRAWTAAYRDRGEPLPQIPSTSSLCQSCQFATRCQRAVAAPDWPAAIAATAEVSL